MYNTMLWHKTRVGVYCRSSRKLWRQDLSFIYQKTQIKLYYLHCNRGRKRERQRQTDRLTIHFSRRSAVAYGKWILQIFLS